MDTWKLAPDRPSDDGYRNKMSVGSTRLLSWSTLSVQARSSALDSCGVFPVEPYTVADHRAAQKPSSIHTLLLVTSPDMAR